MPAPLSRRRKLAYTLVLAAATWLAVELVCWLGLRALARKGIEYTPALVQTLSDKHRGILRAHVAGASTYVVHDPDLGWTIKPNAVKGIYRANAAGIRGDSEYALEPPAGKVRVAAFGDSFTHASDVPNGFTWEERLEELDPGLEVMNFGIPGSDPGQGLLRWRRDGKRYRPHVVLLGFMSENINRVVNVFRPFYFPRSGMPLTKPRFALDGDRLVVIENPIRTLDGYRELLASPETVLPRLGRHDYFYQRRSRRSPLDVLPSARLYRVFADQRLHEPIVEGGVYNTESEAFRVTVALFERFRDEALAAGSVPVVVIFPERKDLRASREGAAVVYGPLRAALARRGIRTIDLLEGFAGLAPDLPVKELAIIHYTKRGNRIAAQHLLAELRRQGLTTLDGAERALAAERERARPRAGGGR